MATFEHGDLYLGFQAESAGALAAYLEHRDSGLTLKATYTFPSLGAISNEPTGIALGADGNLYVLTNFFSGSNQHRLSQIQTDGTVTSLGTASGAVSQLALIPGGTDFLTLTSATTPDLLQITTSLAVVQSWPLDSPSNPNGLAFLSASLVVLTKEAETAPDTFVFVGRFDTSSGSFRPDVLIDTIPSLLVAGTGPHQGIDAGPDGRVYSTVNHLDGTASPISRTTRIIASRLPGGAEEVWDTQTGPRSTDGRIPNFNAVSANGLFDYYYVHGPPPSGPEENDLHRLTIADGADSIVLSFTRIMTALWLQKDYPVVALPRRAFAHLVRA